MMSPVAGSMIVSFPVSVVFVGAVFSRIFAIEVSSGISTIFAIEVSSGSSPHGRGDGGFARARPS
ncbi:hypothetical protein LQL77_30720 [Rhodococcus cerastii]|nr:hypothetical protein [Rhodococcus cerastii]